MKTMKPVEILLIEDDLGDIELTREAMEESKVLANLNVVTNGIEAMAYLRREIPYADAPRPHLILLDLKMPRKDGLEVLADLRADANLKTIPVVVLTTSRGEEDVIKSYDLGANCYITKPVGLKEFAKVVNAIENFWFTIVRLPSKAE